MCSSTSATCENSTALSSSRQSTGIDQLVTHQTSVTRAEIILVLGVVKNYHSFCSCLELANDMSDMSPKNDTVSKFELSKTKWAYVATHCIAPWRKSNLQTKVSNSPFFIVSFIESLNMVLQKKQMDMQSL